MQTFARTSTLFNVKSTRTSLFVDAHELPSSGRCDTTAEQVFVRKLLKYLIVQVPCACQIGDENGRGVPDENRNPIVEKTSTLVEVYAKTSDLSLLL